MKTLTKKLFGALAMLALLLTVFISGCKKDDDDPVVPNKTVYQLGPKDILNVSGTVTFTETSATVTTIEIALTGTTGGGHPAHVHVNSALEGGGIAIPLEDVDDSGTSVTVVTEDNTGTPISYSQLINFDGYVNVHDQANLATIIAQGDIGGNVLTGDKTTYQLTSVAPYTVTGNALFEERKNGNTLVTLSLTGTLDGDDHPAHIHLGSVATVGGGPIAVNLSNVIGVTAGTAKSFTNVKLVIGTTGTTPITYDQLLVYDGYINVHLSATEIATLICQGNIGGNI